MLAIFAVLLGGIATGRLLVGRRLVFVHRLIPAVIRLLLFLLGVEVGGDAEVVRSLPDIGGAALALCTGSVAGSILLSWLLWRRIRRGAAPQKGPERMPGGTRMPGGGQMPGGTRMSGGGQMPGGERVPGGTRIPVAKALRGSLGILLCFAAGCAAGYGADCLTACAAGDMTGGAVSSAADCAASDTVRGAADCATGDMTGGAIDYAADCAASGCRMPLTTGTVSVWSRRVLYLLMFLVGITLGGDRSLAERMRHLDRQLVLLPLATALGTLGGAALAAPFVTAWSTADALAVGAGFGYYSLSGLFIADLRCAELGSVALLCNLLRELFTLVAAPWIARRAGPLAAISIGGATSFDTTLPVITAAAGAPYAVVSIFHGCVLDFSVPFLVTLFCSV